MDSGDDERDVYEKMLEDPSAKPMFLPLSFLKAITCNFSVEQELGRGGYGVVYKGVLRNGNIIAVKKLFDMHLVDDIVFQNEVSYLMSIKHQHVVQLVGYCAESKFEATELPSGKHVLAEIRTRLLCFEYLCNKSLDKHISGLEWNTRYNIIKGICSGLHFLHDECYIVHLDLKPQNILMDANMTPKIADFGLSRLWDEHKSRTIVKGNLAGSLGYMAPEYLIHGVVTRKADIFSLGVIIIEIITGFREYPQSTMTYFQHYNENDGHQSNETSLQQFTHKVLESWREIFQRAPCTSPGLYTQQVKQCVAIALGCVDPDMNKRPHARDIIEMLHAVENPYMDAEIGKDAQLQEAPYRLPVASMDGPSAAVLSDSSADSRKKDNIDHQRGSKSKQDEREKAGADIEEDKRDGFFLRIFKEKNEERKEGSTPGKKEEFEKGHKNADDDNFFRRLFKFNNEEKKGAAHDRNEDDKCEEGDKDNFFRKLFKDEHEREEN